MGVCGCGKTTVGRALADELGWPFLDADEYHPREQRRENGGRRGVDRRRPLAVARPTELVNCATLHAGGRHAILACSALRQVYRDRLSMAGDVKWVYLKGDLATIEPQARVPSRTLHAAVAAREPVRGAGRAGWGASSSTSGRASPTRSRRSRPNCGRRHEGRSEMATRHRSRASGPQSEEAPRRGQHADLSGVHDTVRHGRGTRSGGPRPVSGRRLRPARHADRDRPAIGIRRARRRLRRAGGTVRARCDHARAAWHARAPAITSWSPTPSMGRRAASARISSRTWAST